MLTGGRCEKVSPCGGRVGRFWGRSWKGGGKSGAWCGDPERAHFFHDNEDGGRLGELLKLITVAYGARTVVRSGLYIYLFIHIGKAAFPFCLCQDRSDVSNSFHAQ